MSTKRKAIRGLFGSIAVFLIGLYIILGTENNLAVGYTFAVLGFLTIIGSVVNYRNNV
ncbi:hypothetical protein [Natranaerobius thermophilus]|uniref:Uncharacterized protein n=1 Tax=Natranaerobius thermophilus (strain ATCC BAA-1301 / DSM 18059 / JW/NM-WN-LF) TaxID=457570 RepID=B2A7M3_NATTJ|nr:hypothetical protein [Natranaerobius thermophilus]ACB85732.1 hypothetical protein Nther_2166 [Natranaerobius thermophilus JW/NM-WN-LF]